MKIKKTLDYNTLTILKAGQFKKFLKLKIRKNGVYGKERKNILHLACKYSSVKIIKYCIETIGIDSNQKSSSKNNVLHYACRTGNYQVVKYLCNSNSLLIDEKNKKNQTPLYIAAKYNHERICIYLINKGADIFIREKNK